MNNAPIKKITILEAEMNMKSISNHLERLYVEIDELEEKIKKTTKQSKKEELMRELDHYQFMDRLLHKALNEMSTLEWKKNNCKDIDAWIEWKETINKN